MSAVEFLIIIVLFIGMMWLMSRGQRKQAAAAERFRSALEVGQNVVTHSGMYGRIVDIDGDAVTLETTPGVETLWRRAAVASLADPPFAVVDDEDGTDVEAGTDPDGALPHGAHATPSVPDDASSLTGPPAPPPVAPTADGVPPSPPARETDRPDDDAGRPPAR